MHCRNGETALTPTARLHDLGQSLWLDNITRKLLDDGTLARYIDDLAVTGLTANPTILQHAIKGSAAYDADIRGLSAAGRRGEALFFDLALADLTRAADLFRPTWEHTHGVDGWVSLEVSPLLADDTAGSVAAARELHARAARPNLFIKIPGTAAGLPAIEEAIFAGVPVNVTLLFSAAQVLAAADAWLRGIERRIAAGLPAVVASVASLFVSRWDVAAAPRVPADLHLKLGIAVGHQSLAAYNAWQASPRVKRAMNFGAPPQRLLFASTGMKDPQASPTRYVEALAAPFTIDTIPEATLHALAERGRIEGAAPADGGDCEAVLAAHRAAGIDLDALAARLQTDGVAAFNASWRDLMAVLEARGAALAG